jgi:hypothetical protein
LGTFIPRSDTPSIVTSLDPKDDQQFYSQSPSSSNQFDSSYSFSDFGVTYSPDIIPSIGVRQDEAAFPPSSSDAIIIQNKRKDPVAAAALPKPSKKKKAKRDEIDEIFS